jgi:hypothetical protein
MRRLSHVKNAPLMPMLVLLVLRVRCNTLAPGAAGLSRRK